MLVFRTSSSLSFHWEAKLTYEGDRSSQSALYETIGVVVERNERAPLRTRLGRLARRICLWRFTRRTNTREVLRGPVSCSSLLAKESHKLELYELSSGSGRQLLEKYLIVERSMVI